MMRKNIYIDNEYADRHPAYHVEDSPWKAQQIFKMIERNNLDPQTIGDVGCGAGEVLRQLQALLPAGKEFFGYDISSKAIELGKRRENANLKFFCEDLLAKELEPFDLVLCVDVFEHVDDYMGFLSKLRNKAHFIIFHIPLDIAMINIILGKTLIGARESIGHLHYFTKDTAIATLEDTGYKIVDSFFTSGGIDRVNTLPGRVLRWPRKVMAQINNDFAARVLGGFSLLVLAK